MLLTYLFCLHKRMSEGVHQIHTQSYVMHELCISVFTVMAAGIVVLGTYWQIRGQHLHSNYSHKVKGGVNFGFRQM
jgi:hypothetical protein